MLRRRLAVVRLGLWLPIVFLGLAVPALGQSGRTFRSEEADDGVERVPPPGDAVALMRKNVEKVEWDEKPFEEILEWLREQSDFRVNVNARWGPLGNEGVERERPVTLTMMHVSVAEILEEVRAQISEEDRVRYQASKNSIVFSSKSDFDRKLIRKVYYVGDILFRVPNFQEEAPQIDLSGQNSNQGGGGGGGTGGGGGGGSGSVFQNAGGGGQQGQQGQDEQEIEERVQRIRDAIILTVHPDTWADTPGEGGFGGGSTLGLGNGRVVALVQQRSLIVLNTIEVHEDLAGWFELHR